MRLLASSLAGALAGCPPHIEDPDRFFDAAGGIDSPSGIDAPTVCSLGDDWVERELLPHTCATAFCHSATDTAAGLDLASPNIARRLVGVRASASCHAALLIDPAQPTAGLFLAKLGARVPCGQRMPLGPDALNPGQLACVQRWVATLAAAPATDGGIE